MLRGRIHEEAVAEWEARQAVVVEGEARTRGGEYGFTQEGEDRDRWTLFLLDSISPDPSPEREGRCTVKAS